MILILTLILNITIHVTSHLVRDNVYKEVVSEGDKDQFLPDTVWKWSSSVVKFFKNNFEIRK